MTLPFLSYCETTASSRSHLADVTVASDASGRIDEQTRLSLVLRWESGVQLLVGISALLNSGVQADRQNVKRGVSGRDSHPQSRSRLTPAQRSLFNTAGISVLVVQTLSGTMLSRLGH